VGNDQKLKPPLVFAVCFLMYVTLSDIKFVSKEENNKDKEE